MYNSIEQFMDALSSKNPEQLRQAQRQGLMDPVAFKQMYDQQLSTVATSMAAKILDYQAKTYKSDSDMREWLKAKGLTK